MTNEMIMVPSAEFKRLTDYYKGELTENALLNKAARLAATKHILTQDKRIPPALAVKRIQPIAKEVGQLTKRIRHAPVRTTPGLPDEEEDDSLLNTPLENLLKQMIKKDKGPPPIKKEPVTPSTSGPKKEPKSSGIPILKKERPSGIKTIPWKRAQPSTSKAKKPTPAPPSEAQALAEEIRQTLASESKGKQPARRPRKTEAERLKPQQGWEDWAQFRKLRRKLDYDED